MPNSELERIAPRIARAWRAEQLYQERKRHQARHGYMAFDIAVEEMVRAMRNYTNVAFPRIVNVFVENNIKDSFRVRS